MTATLISEKKTTFTRPQLRGQVYAFLRRVFTRELDEEFLAWYREQDNSLWDSLGIEFSTSLEGGDTDKLTEDLAVEFCRLFITSGQSGRPYESLHVNNNNDKDGPVLLVGEPFSQVKELYREAGFEVDENEHQIADSLGVELEFMERLCLEEAEAEIKLHNGDLKKIRNSERRMLKEHLAKWVPGWARGLRPAVQGEFYGAMLDLLADFIEWDLDQLED